MQKPEEAIQNLLGEQFIEWLFAFIGTEVKAWTELQLLRGAKPRIEKMRKFMLQRFLAEEAFWGSPSGDPGFLGFAIGNLSESNDPLAETSLSLLEQSRSDELGHDRELWLKLLAAMGITDEEFKRAEPKEATRNYIAYLSDVYSNSDWQTAAGAYTAHKLLRAEEYSALSQFLSINLQLSASQLEVFQNPQVPARVLDKIVFDLENKQLVWAGVSGQLATQRDFYKGLSKYLVGPSISTS
ncbi:MAG: hypothetical protein A3H72_02340 [Candidatus Doudnabacteria bacterium RIFCSPLOWO2_02_FULL_48_8]|uniref:Thiaminase-2/PQQC domain-containing protein n=1 Tax=Candidatus Doudnabacteria bacterium RIFCSPHIGHO2_01_FULL_46_24 TaxID=1817825 RepID=A0A1F5NSX2_9BACT|nr:MAG: hypothetical protein A2720_04390 [Candidatus Doudnabacteria bacterium RIFCSPHIGHO2_01_FULL_46_24]OGE95727.1 MAG: hypothetical protein A3H72_02340 [Candidatus Doudnabacteria bacterium RIFCSPLOWO2_02_FULL_48_8]OGE96158.1 MAG: hypothetical protein A3E98_03575 [Candidatus Doudnabacteria bacterium RIFCSPHIGHO2_12_FULL_48_11]